MEYMCSDFFSDLLAVGAPTRNMLQTMVAAVAGGVFLVILATRLRVSAIVMGRLP